MKGNNIQTPSYLYDFSFNNISQSSNNPVELNLKVKVKIPCSVGFRIFEQKRK